MALRVFSIQVQFLYHCLTLTLHGSRKKTAEYEHVKLHKTFGSNMFQTLQLKVCKTKYKVSKVSSSHQLVVPRMCLVSVGDRSFSSVGSRLWNALPREVVECQTLETFRQKLKHFLFSLSFPGH